MSKSQLRTKFPRSAPHVGAPAFRALDRRVDLVSFIERLREGHPDMPTFRFTREDARGFLLYLRSISGAVGAC
jgi:hypothetical protein